MSKDMSVRNRSNFNTDSGLTPNGGGAGGVSPGSGSEGERAQVSDGLEAAASGIPRPSPPEPPPLAPSSSRTHNRPGGATGASCGRSTSWPTPPARTRSRRRPAARCPPGAEDLQVPAKPRWLLSIPDAISQLEQLDRTLLTRRDVERLFGVSKARAATLMQTFGAELVGNQRTLPRTKLLQQLKKHRGRAAFRGEEERRARLVAELQQARLTGVRFKVPAETLSAKLANLPEGVSVARGRIEVRFDGAENALERLFALAQALGNDYVRFEELVGR